MNSVELIDKREQLHVKADALLNGAEKEQRKLTNEEQAIFEEIKRDIASVEEEIRKINDELSNKPKEIRKMEKFSLIKAIYNVANNKQLDERSTDVVNAGIAEMRKSGQSFSGQIVLPVEERADKVQATVDGAGIEAVATDKLNILEPLRANLVMAQAGATVMTGLVGNVSIPVYSGSNVGWKGEIDPADNGAGTFNEVELSPKRLTAYLDISKQFLIQDSASAEQMLMNDIVRAISDKLEETILGTAAGTNDKPEGMFAYASDFADNVTYENIVKAEAELEAKNVNNYSFIASPYAKARMKMTQKGNGVGFIMEGNEVDGYPVLVSSHAQGILAGDFSDYVIAQWGGIDLTVDPYTQAANGCVRLVINAYFDAKPRRKESFFAATVDNFE